MLEKFSGPLYFRSMSHVQKVFGNISRRNWLNNQLSRFKDSKTITDIFVQCIRNICNKQKGKIPYTITSEDKNQIFEFMKFSNTVRARKFQKSSS